MRSIHERSIVGRTACRGQIDAASFVALYPPASPPPSPPAPVAFAKNTTLDRPTLDTFSSNNLFSFRVVRVLARADYAINRYIDCYSPTVIHSNDRNY